jgi:hypothetical protein
LAFARFFKFQGQKNTKLDDNNILKYIFSESPIKSQLNWWKFSGILIGLNLNQSEFSSGNFFIQNKAHFRHPCKILRKIQFLKMSDLKILLDCGHPTLQRTLVFSSWTSGFISGFVMSCFLFGHFRHQGVKILKCHKPIFCSK